MELPIGVLVDQDFKTEWTESRQDVMRPKSFGDPMMNSGGTASFGRQEVRRTLYN